MNLRLIISPDESRRYTGFTQNTLPPLGFAYAVELHVGEVKQLSIPCSKQTTVEINRTFPRKTKFILFEAHSQWYNLSVSSKPQLTYGLYENGTNVGVLIKDLKSLAAYVSCQHMRDAEYIDVLVKATVYEDLDPVPGGCNMEFPMAEDPNIHIVPGAFTTRVAFQYANLGSANNTPPNCEKPANTKLLKYLLYEYTIGDISETSYMQGMQEILTGLLPGGKVAKYHFGSGQTLATFESDLYQASVFTVEVTQMNEQGQPVGQSLYVPAATYGYKQGVKYSTSAVAWAAIVLLVLMAALGLFIAFLGHRFFQVEMAFFGYLAFQIILLILLLKFSSLDLSACCLIALCVGLFGGLLWWLFWFFKGIPIIAVILPGFTMGFVLAGLIFNLTPLGETSLMQNTLSYGMAYASAVLLPTVILLYFTKILNLVCCSLVGSFLPLFAASQFFSGHFSSIVLDTFKACRDPAFLQAIRTNKPNVNDIILLSVWACLFICCLIFQYINERKRPPFPPCPYERLKKRRLITAHGGPGGVETSGSNVQVDPEREPLVQPHAVRRPNNSYGTGLSMISSQDQEVVDPI